MTRRNIFKTLTGLFAAKSLPVAPVRIPASLQVAKAAAATNPLFSGGLPEWGGMNMHSFATTSSNRVTLNRVGQS